MSKPDDASEREADRVADLVTRRDAPASNVIPRAGVSSAGTSSNDGYLDHLEGRGQPLPRDLREELEPRFGHDFSGVRVHRDGEAADSADAFGALAFTYGRHVVFGAGQFDSASRSGRTLLAHELAHVVQQAGGPAPGIIHRQRKNPIDLSPDVCVTAPVVGTVCGSGAAKVCGKMPSLPGCGAVCKVFDCPKPVGPTTICPPGWQGTTASGFEGQCCKGDIASAQACCPPDRIAINEGIVGRCCGPDEVVRDQHCVKSKDLPPIIPSCPPPGRQTLLGQCCFPPEVPQGLTCGLPVAPTPTPPAPKPAPAVVPPIFFNLDRPSAGDTLKSFDTATTAEGRANFDALLKALRGNPALKVQLVGRASPEGSDAYNVSLGERRARMVADALQAAGISAARIADDASFDPGAGCAPLGSGLSSCGKAGATGARDRQVLAHVHGG